MESSDCLPGRVSDARWFPWLGACHAWPQEPKRVALHVYQLSLQPRAPQQTVPYVQHLDNPGLCPLEPLWPPKTLCTFTLTCSDFGSKPSWCQSCWCYTIFLNLYSSGFCTAQGLLGRNGLRSDYSRGRLSAQNYSSKAVPSAMLCAAIYRNVVKSAQQQKSRQLQTGKCTVQPSLLQESKTFETKTRTWRTG